MRDVREARSLPELAGVGEGLGRLSEFLPERVHVSPLARNPVARTQAGAGFFLIPASAWSRTARARRQTRASNSSMLIAPMIGASPERRRLARAALILVRRPRPRGRARGHARPRPLRNSVRATILRGCGGRRSSAPRAVTGTTASRGRSEPSRLARSVCRIAAIRRSIASTPGERHSSNWPDPSGSRSQARAGGI